ncbi:MAG: outer membrane protein assembly factor BamB family protein [Candidatus Zipacnadales bacterium]
MRSTLVLGVLLLPAVVSLFVAQNSSEQDPVTLARQILSETGVQGGLIVHVGCDDGRLTGALRMHPGFLVHGLTTNARQVRAARAYLQGRSLYGPVSVDRWDGVQLPYADNLVNLLVRTNGESPNVAEVQRVLVPNGVAYLKKGRGWEKIVKPRPANIDEWTHYLHGPDGNPVSHDQVVGPPRRLQWVGSPRWARHHDHMASMTALVAANGRLFYILDEGPTASIQLPPHWALIARDAFNGTILWKRDILSWNTHQWPLKSGPAHLLRRLVAVGNRVFVTLSLDGPVSMLEAATGEVIRSYENSDQTSEILVSDDILLAVKSVDAAKLLQWRRRDTYVWDNTNRANREWAWAGEIGSIKAYEVPSGRLLWHSEQPVAPCSCAADKKRIVFYDGAKVVCLSLQDGSAVWESEPLAASIPVVTSTGIRLLLDGDVVLFAGNTGTMTALSASDGHKLWEGKHLPSGHQSLRDLLVIGGVAWTGAIANGKDSGTFIGYDLLSGQVKSQFDPDVETYWFHHRCYPIKATDRYILTSRTGIEFVDPAAQHWECHHWVRGGCIYGVLPCNGMVYAPMHSCGCYLEAKLNGFNALAPGPVVEPDPLSLRDEARLERGPAYGHSTNVDAAPTDWPTYRHDAARSGSTPHSASLDRVQGWKTQLGGRLTAPVVAGGRLYVASIDTHTLHALDATTGRPRWAYTVGGRIDSPPTLYRGLVLFGSADGYVYALRASDGTLAWRYRAAPLDRRIVAFEQLESTWPVHGSVLVRDGVLYCTAGRSIFLDGGIRLLRLNPLTGRKLSETVMDERDPQTGENMQVHVKGLNMPVALSDILSSDGDYIYMRSQKFDLEGNRLEISVQEVANQPTEGSHIFCQVGFLDDSWFHRSYWTFGRRVAGGYGGWFLAGRLVPAGRILAFDDEHVYGYGRKPEYMVNASVLEYHLFGAEKFVTPEAIQRVQKANTEINARLDKNMANASDWKLRRYFPIEDLAAARFKWRIDQPSLQVRAMVVAGDTLFVAGHPDFIDERRAFRLPDDPEVQAQLLRQAEALEGHHGGRLWVISATDGRPLARYSLPAPPVFDGMAVADGRVYLCDVRGAVICLSSGDETGLQLLDDTEPLSVVSEEPEEPDYLKPPEVDKSSDFTQVTRCRVVESDIGYRIKPNGEQMVCLALNKLDVPLTGKVTLTTSIRVEEKTGFLQNGFLAFGDGATDEQLVKCGVRYRLQKAMIVQGPLLEGGKSTSANVTAEVGKIVPLTVTVDLTAQTVHFTVGGTTLEAKLERALPAITHLGFCCDSAIVDFSPVQAES